MKIEFVGVPFDLCGPVLGSRLGPAAMRIGGLMPKTQALVDSEDYRGPSGGVSPEFLDLSFPHDLSVETDTVPWELKHLHPVTGERQDRSLRNFPVAQDIYRETRKAFDAVFERGNLPVMIGGDHSLSMCSVSAALEQTKGDLAVLWIDAHGDMNTPGTSPSGRLHGMPLAALLGLPSHSDDATMSKQWEWLQSDVIGIQKVKEENLAWIGLRDVDYKKDHVERTERDNIEACQGSFVRSMEDVDRDGLGVTLDQFKSWLKNTGAKNLWISFDVDSLDPIYAPGTGTKVRGGLTYREGHQIAEFLGRLIWETKEIQLAGMDLVEVNPLLDHQNETAQYAIEWLCSFFGKRILRAR